MITRVEVDSNIKADRYWNFFDLYGFLRGDCGLEVTQFKKETGNLMLFNAVDSGNKMLVYVNRTTKSVIVKSA